MVSSQRQKIIVVLPTYNEAENIAQMIDALCALRLPGLEILVVDDSSPDGTGHIVRSLMNTNHSVHLLSRTAPRGRGAAGIAGYREALRLGADVVCEMDADFSHDPRYLPDLLRRLENADMALGSRAVQGGSDADRLWYRRIVTILANFYIRLVLGVPVRDCNSGYRCFRRRVLETIDLDRVITRGPGIVQEILYLVYLAGFTIAEVPISFVERKKGASKLGFRHLYAGYFLILKLRLLHALGKI